MKILFGVMALLAVIYFMSAFTQPSDVNGASEKTANNSAKKLSRHMTDQQKHLFETSFWTLKSIKSKEGPQAFLDAVDGKTPDEVVEMAKQEVSAKIAAGDPDFRKYSSWEDFVNDQTKEDKKKIAVPPLRNSSRTGRPE